MKYLNSINSTHRIKDNIGNSAHITFKVLLKAYLQTSQTTLTA